MEWGGVSVRACLCVCVYGIFIFTDGLKAVLSDSNGKLACFAEAFYYGDCAQPISHNPLLDLTITLGKKE